MLPHFTGEASARCARMSLRTTRTFETRLGAPARHARARYTACMTRKQVARRLGKSIATVRRIEGVLLHPTRDERGIHHFEPDEVESLASDVERGVVALSSDFGLAERNPPSESESRLECPTCLALEQTLDSFRGKLAAQERTHRLAVERLRAEREHEAAAHQREARELVAQVEHLLAAIE